MQQLYSQIDLDLIIYTIVFINCNCFIHVYNLQIIIKSVLLKSYFILNVI